MINDDENFNISKPSSVNSVIVFDDSQCVSSPPQLSVVQIESQNTEEQPLRRSKRGRPSTVKNVNEVVKQSHRLSRRKKRVTNSDDIPVIIFDEDYPIPQCSYLLPKQKRQSEEDPNKSVSLAPFYFFTIVQQNSHDQ